MHPFVQDTMVGFATITAVPVVWSLLWGFFKDLAR